jgi:hypothetical protein
LLKSVNKIILKVLKIIINRLRLSEAHTSTHRHLSLKSISINFL